MKFGPSQTPDSAQPFPKARKDPHELTDEDKRRLAKAEAKRERKRDSRMSTREGR